MKAVIMAAGKGTRCYPLTLARPKPMLKILNRTILEHNLSQLRGIVDEAVIVVGYKKEMISEKIKNRYYDIKVTFVEQKEQIGTGNALMLAESLVDDRFILMNGDDLFSKGDIERCIGHKYSILCCEVEAPQNFGIVYLMDNSFVFDIVEKPEKPESRLANTGLYVLDTKIFGLLKKIKKSKRNEYEVTSAIKELAKDEKVMCEKVMDYWIPMTYPWNYLEANVFMLKRMKKRIIKGKVEPNVTIKGDVYIGQGSVVKSGSYIEGPAYIGDDCEVGPNAYIRPDTVLMNMVRARGEIVDSVLMDGCTAKHSCYIGHSVLGEGSNIGAGTITADFRHDERAHVTIVSGNKVKTGRRKLGSFMGDKVHTGIGTLIYPGRKIWPGIGTLPGEIVLKDKMA